MTSMKRLAAVAAALALAGTMALAGCSADSAGQSDLTQSTVDGVPVVDRSGNANFPDVTGEFGTKPEIAAGKGEPPAVISVKTLSKGDGPVIGLDDTVKVNYMGVLWDGTQFDSSFESGTPISFSLNSVIQGWKYGLAEQNVGDRVEIVIPAQWAYGDRETGTIPANSTLVFVVDLLATIDPTDISALSNATATDETVPGITVTGDLGTEPTITYEGDVPTSESTAVLAKGAGAAVEKGQTVIIHGVASLFGTEQTESTWAETPVEVAAEAFDLVGKTVGSRVLLVRPVAAEDQQSGAEPAAHVFVIDIVAAM